MEMDKVELRGCLKSHPEVASVQYTLGMNANPYPTDLSDAEWDLIKDRSYWVSGSFETSSAMSDSSNALPRLRTL